LRSAASGAALVARGLFTALFPSDCRLCSIPLTNISRLPVCQSCLLAMVPLAVSTCEICGERLGADYSAANQICPACQESRPQFIKAAAYGAYDGGLRELIHLLKYEQVGPAAGVLGQMLAEAIQKLSPIADSILVIPVPLHRSKRRQRGFNQAELIARAALKIDGLQAAELATDVLERTRPTVSQIGLTRPQRVENIRGAFRIRHPSRVSGRNVVLVDDVLTTGTTASECARILLKAGAEKVWIATVARTLKESGFESGRFRPEGAALGEASMKTAKAS
jgi:ComF family protein